MFVQLGFSIVALIMLFALPLVFVAIRDGIRKRRSQRLAREAAAKWRAELDERNEKWRREREAEARRSRPVPAPDPLREDPQWPELVLDHVLRELQKKPKDSSSISKRMKTPELTYLNEKEIRRARDRAVHEGLARYDDDRQRWRLTRRGVRIFEEYAGDRKRMDEAEKKRHQPHIMIDARGAGNVAHTVNGGIFGTTVNNASGTFMPEEVDLQTVLELLEQLRRALPDTEGLSDLARDRAEGDLIEVDRELRAPEEEREASRVQAALERLRTTFLGVDGLIEVVNQIWDHLRGWLPGG
ncbi:hypothetical protein [Streptomyces sp. NPDC127033]|uniref:hypothetical protein n=1 Tax=Streptomyces sp. NPDC127033 TaxID=3347110 RepID=UPI003651F25E